MKAFGDKNAASNREPPFIALVSSSNTDGVYVTGNKITITVKFSKPVLVSGAGHISLSLATGDHPAQASYQSASPSDTLNLLYVVGKSEKSADLQYTDVNALTCNSDTTIRDDIGHDAILTLPELSTSSSLGGQKQLVINSTTATVDQNSAVYDDLGLHFEKNVYQTRSAKRLLIKRSEVAGMSTADVLWSKSSYSCEVFPDYDSTLELAALIPADMQAISGALASAPYGVTQKITLGLDGVGITPNQTTEQVMLKDFATFSIGGSNFNGVQTKGGFQGSANPISTGAAVSGDTVMITGFIDMINR